MSKNYRYILAAAILAFVVVYYAVSTRERNKRIYSSGEERTVKFGGQTIPFARFNDAETLRSERSPELIAEILKVLEQKGMPADIFINNVLDAHNIALTLNTLFREVDDKVDDKKDDDKEKRELLRKLDKEKQESLRKLWDNSPLDVWDTDKKKIDGVAETLKQFETARFTVRGMLEQPKTVFYYIFSRDKYWRSQIDTDASRFIADYALLEEYAIAKALLQGDLTTATEAVAYVFRLAQLTDDLPVVGVRCDAALTRMRFIEVLQRIVLDEKMDRKYLVFLRDMLSEQLDHWTPENKTWFGDRASGIWLYHRIMLYGPSDALESFEIDKLTERNVYGTFVKTFNAKHAGDEVFYLQSMQKVLDVSAEPFFKRLDVINGIQNTILKAQNTSAETFVADLVLDNIDKFMRLFAQDRSRMETALLALRLALEHDKEKAAKLTAASSDPFSGKPYQITEADGFIEVSAQNKHRPFRVKSGF